MSDQIFKMTKVYKSIKPDKENLSDLIKIQKEMGAAAKARDDIKTLIVKDQESEIKIQGAGSEDFSMFESELDMKGES
jgi:protein-arginine kinase activator protein McsA